MLTIAARPRLVLPRFVPFLLCCGVVWALLPSCATAAFTPHREEKEFMRGVAEGTFDRMVRFSAMASALLAVTVLGCGSGTVRRGQPDGGQGGGGGGQGGSGAAGGYGGNGGSGGTGGSGGRGGVAK